MKEILNIDDFTALLLATLANEFRTLQDEEARTAVLPMQYKQIIENILCMKKSWRREFSILINTDEYFLDHFLWEEKLAVSIKNFLDKYNKSLECDLKDDKLKIAFTPQEVDDILAKYPDKKVKCAMKHFVYLFDSYIHSRIYQERFYDYYAKSVELMAAIHAPKDAEKKRVRKLF